MCSGFLHLSISKTKDISLESSICFWELLQDQKGRLNSFLSANFLGRKSWQVYFGKGAFCIKTSLTDHSAVSAIVTMKRQTLGRSSCFLTTSHSNEILPDDSNAIQLQVEGWKQKEKKKTQNKSHPGISEPHSVPLKQLLTDSHTCTSPFLGACGHT
jgi:hypothetical protein